MGRVTLQTVADKVGVSRMTVSNAFSRPDQLSATLRSTILAAAESSVTSGPTRRPGRWPAAHRLGRRPADRLAELRLHRRGRDRLPRRDRRRARADRAGPHAAVRLGHRDASRPATSRWTARSSTPASRLGRAATGCVRRNLPARLRRPGPAAGRHRASTSTTAAGPAPPRSTWSTSATAASASSAASGTARTASSSSRLASEHHVPGADAGLARRARAGRHRAARRPPGSDAGGRRPTRRPAAARPRRPADGDPVLLRRDGLRGGARRRGPRPDACRATSRSSASTTTRWPAGCGRRSPRCARTWRPRAGLRRRLSPPRSSGPGRHDRTGPARAAADRAGGAGQHRAAAVLAAATPADLFRAC